MKLSQITSPSAVVEPVSLYEMREHLRIDHDEEVAYIMGCISAARAAAEQQIDSIIARRQYRLTLDDFAPFIELPFRTVDAESVAIEYTDANAQTQTFIAFDYVTENEIVFLRPDLNAQWPTTESGRDKVRISFYAGYSDVPQDIKHAIMLIGAALHDQRRDHTAQALRTAPTSSHMLLEPYRRNVL